MAMQAEVPRAFRLYVTHVDGEGHFLKISGQLDQQSSLMVETLFEAARENLERGVGAAHPAAIQEGTICAAKYKDGVYYRAKIINTTSLATGLIGVHFIDFGNKDIISLSTIRFLDNYDPMFFQLRGQATDYYLSRIMHPAGKWDEPLLLKLQSLLCYAEYPVTIEAHTRTYPIISMQFKGNDLSSHLVTNRYGAAIPVAKQEVLLLTASGDSQQNSWRPNLVSESPFTEHVPFLINQGFPSNPASAMRLQQNASLSFSNVPPPSIISQRLLVSKTTRTPVNMRVPSRQPQHAVQSGPLVSPPPAPAVVANKSLSPKKSTTYKSRLLEVNSQHKVFVSYAEEGPELFAVQLVTDAKKLQDMMDDINRRPHSSLAEPPMIGTVCLGRMSGDRIICRAIVMNLSGSQCKLFFVDFGDTEMVSYYDIFDIPEEFVKPNVFAMRFCLSGVKKLEKGPHLNETFKQLVNGKVLTLRVVAPEGPPLIQYGELYLDNTNVLDLLLANLKDKLQFTWMEMLPLGTKRSVLVSYVDSCLKFYMQLSEKIDELNAVMDAVKAHCENSTAPGELPVGAACCARFPDDDNWYRARVRETKGNKVVVAYVDYGNEQEVNISDLRTITPELIRLPAQSMKCALKGFENRPVETKTSNQLEMLALEKTLMANIVGVLSSDTMLVTLIDDTVVPPLDVAKKMMQLSQPRNTGHEMKPTSPSSPEGSVPDEGWKKSFRREKSFKDERKPRDTTEEFGQRGSSFRARDNREPFDRSGPGRHSDKYAGRPDRGERRDGPRPRDNNFSPPAAPPGAADDEWEESPPAPSFQSPPPRSNFRDNRDRRAGEPAPGRGRREPARRPRNASSVQDRLKRDNKFNDREDKRPDDQGFRPRENRFERRDNRTDNRENRGERRDNWGDKKENWQKREFKDNRSDFKDSRPDYRDNRSERPDRNKSNFTPRDRADRNDRSFEDKKSDRSFNSNDGRAGRAPPYKSRSKFTQVQYKELASPVPLTSSFAEPVVELSAQHEVSVTWIISPESFYTQIMSLQPKFLEMMHTIPELYKGVRSYTGDVPVGAAVLARYPVDGVLYRANIVSVQPFSKFIVRYVDFGNKQLVDAKDIWQLDSQLMELPKMAVHCSLLGVGPKDGEWKANPEIDLCFNAPRYQCVFEEQAEDAYKVSLWNNGVSVADTLVEKELAVMLEKSSVTVKDEAIDLTIIVGQQILCRVTHVESYDKFYVQLDLDKADLVEAAIDNFDTAKLTALPGSGLAAGVHCTTSHDARTRRAIVTDATDPRAVAAVLPDYGINIVTQLDKLMILPQELTVYFYQSLECKLNNYTAESEKLIGLDELKQTLTGNKFIIYINDVEEITLVTTLYSISTGEKVSIFTPDEGAYSRVTPLCVRSVFNYNFGRAFLAHLESLQEFYLQREADGDRLATMIDDLYKFYEEGTPEPLTEFEVEGICAAKSADGNWYRATIVSLEGDDVKVQYSDYGNTETLPKDSLKKLDPKFYEPCALALVAGLGLVAVSDEAKDKLIEWTTDKEVQVTLAFGQDGWLASLHLDGVDLSMKLVEEKLATPHMDVTEEPKVETTVEEPVSLPSGCTQVYIGHIDSPGQFWLQMADKIDSIEEIQAILQANADSYPEIENREMGTVCVAKYLADDQWYRAEILDADSDITTVRFIDYGNTDVLDNQPGLIKEVPENLKSIERYAIKSSVNAVPTGTGQWSEPSSDYFTQLVGDLSAPVDALIVLKDVTTYVDIFVNGQNLTDKLVSEGHASKSEETECGDLPSCFASHVNSPSEFWIQLESATPELQSMETAMVDAENFPELTDKEEGVLCAAKYPEDDAWYRAQVIVDGSEGTEVLFMDYGNASIATELRNLPNELKTKPALSRKCALQKPRDIKSWSRKSEVKFNELAAEGATIFNVQFIASGDISIVELYLEGKSVTEELVGLCEEQPIAERPAPVGQDLLSSGKLCYVAQLEDFYVQLDDSADNIDKVISRLADAPQFDPVTELKLGSLCAAFWSEDQQWYRAKVLEFCDVGYHVLFIDYGNKAKCEECKQLPEDIAAIEPLAKSCRLAGVTGDTKPENLKDQLDGYAAEAVTFQIEFLDSTKEPSLVRLYIDGKDVTSVTNSTSSFVETVESADSAIASVIDSVQVENAEEVNNATEEKVSEPAGEQEGKVVSEEVEKAVNEEEIKTIDNDEVMAVESAEVEEKVEKVVSEEEETVVSAKTEEKVVKVVSEEAEVPTEEIIEKNVEVVNKVIDGETAENIIEDVFEDSKDILDATTEQTITEDDSNQDVKVKDIKGNLDELDTSQPDLNESMESNHTVIENTSFEAKGDSLDGDLEEDKSEDTVSPNKNDSTDTLESSKGTIKTPERDDSKDSITTDTGYTSDQESSPTVDAVSSNVIVENDKEEATIGIKDAKTDSPKKDEITEVVKPQ